MGHLTQMLVESKALEKLPKPDQTIYLLLANRFESNTEYLFMSHEELHINTDLATPDTWKDFLNMLEVQNFIKGQMAFLGQVSQRKTFRSLVELALSGNQQAAKQVQELSGIMNQQDTNRVIILHQIPRPNRDKEETNNG